MATRVNTLYGANVYINGSSYFGQVEEVTLPDLKPVMLEHKAVGMVGKIETSAMFDKAEARFKFNSIYPEAMKLIADVTTSCQVQIRGNLEEWVAGSKTGEVPCIAFLTGIWKQVPAVVIKQQDNPEAETMLAVHSYRLEIDRQEIFHLDFMASIYRVNGVDKLEQYRANLGI